jgi:predicted alpha/beta superfamily hydrolase
MKKIFLGVLSLTAAWYANAQTEENIVIGKKLTIYSNTLKENRKILVYTPNTTSSIPGNDRRFPVLYLLDGGAHFLSTVGIIQQLSQANGNVALPEMIVVGIENTDRSRDLTPAPTNMGSSEMANPFIHFLSSELIPFIDKNYSTAPYKVLVGHSLGGLTAIDILANAPGMFNAYIAIDPTMWYDKERFLNNAMAKLPKADLRNKRLFVGMANTMPGGMNLSEAKHDTTAETKHIRSILKLDNFLSGNTNLALKYTSKYYGNDNHNSVPLISEYDALRFVFDYFFMHVNEKDFEDSTPFIATKLKAHYENITREMGYTVAPLEAVINYFAYDALSKKQFSKAAAFLQLNIENYPTSAKAFDAFADYCVAIQDTTNAILNYQKALALTDDSSIRNKLNLLTQKARFSLTENELKKYAGTYILENIKIAVVLEIRNGKLYSKVAGQEDSEFFPVSKDVFTLKDKQGYTITFQMNGERAIGFTSVQPNGMFKAVVER